MEKRTNPPADPGNTHTTTTAEPAVIPDVASQPHPTPQTGDQPAGEGLLRDVLPEIAEVARKVGGYKRLAELATQLDRSGQ